MKRGEGKVISASGKAHSFNWRLIQPASNDNFYLWLMEILPKSYFFLRYIRLQQVAFNSHSRHNKRPQIPCKTAFVLFSANLLLGLLRHDMSKVYEFGTVCYFFSFYFFLSAMNQSASASGTMKEYFKCIHQHALIFAVVR